MIITQLQGGFGNQLFQYAAACSLSKKHHVNVLCDAFWFKNEHEFSRHYMLDKLFKNHKFLSQNKSKLLHNTHPSLIHKLMKRILFYDLNYFYEYSIAFNNEFFKLPRNTYLEGNFQSYKYHQYLDKAFFAEITEGITLRTDAKEALQKIQALSGIAVHVRRGDYAKNAHTNSIHGTLEMSYYFEAMRYFESKFENPVFFIFSDDVEYIKAQFNQNEKCVFLTNPGSFSDMEEFYLMTNCSHHIIANSSFSWWAAYLRGKKCVNEVVCPQHWFRNAPKGFVYEDLIPQNWIKI